MHKSLRAALALGTLLTIVAALGTGAAAGVRAPRAPSGPSWAWRDHGVKHVLLISVDGLHAQDVQNYIALKPWSTLAWLSRRGTTYANAATVTPSDSFPGLIALITGGSPRTTGVWYDNSYDRTLFAAGSNCQGSPGTNVLYDEHIDKNLNLVDGGGIDPAKLPMQQTSGGCVPLYPHSYIRVNTVFEIAHQAGLRTAWADKHPAYEVTAGPSGTGVDDLYTPEINNVNDPTLSVTKTAANDELKVHAVLNEIRGLDSTGSTKVGTPGIFGMNFQAVSVGQKIVTGGYNNNGTQFSAPLVQGLGSVDEALGDFVSTLKKRGLLDSTQIIVSAKHGQSPINRSLLHRIGDPVATILSGFPVAQETTDDVALLWFASKDQSRTGAAATALAADQFGANTAMIDQIYAKANLQTHGFGDPATDPRVPDMIVEPTPGVIYTGSAKKDAEHGGGAPDDLHVALLVYTPHSWGSAGRTIETPVSTRQVAPTLLASLGLDPQALNAVQIEGTAVLPTH